MSSYLKNKRKEVGLTQKQIADMVGVSEATVSRWESGDIANMRRDRIALLASALRTTPGFVMTGKENEEQPTTTKDDELLNALQSDPTKLMLARWICRLNEEQLQMVEGILQAVIGKSDQ